MMGVSRTMRSVACFGPANWHSGSHAGKTGSVIRGIVLAILAGSVLGGCGQIREVEVNREGMGTSGGEEDDSDTLALTDSGDGSESESESDSTQTDRDTDPDVETTGGEAPPETRVAFCSSTVSELTADTIAMEVEVAGHDEGTDPWVGIRGMRSEDLPLDVTLEKVGARAVKLIDATSCTGSFDIMFADEGQDIETTCAQATSDPSNPTMSIEPLADLIEDGADGTWRVTLALSEQSPLELYAVCVSFPTLAAE